MLAVCVCVVCVVWTCSTRSCANASAGNNHTHRPEARQASQPTSLISWPPRRSLQGWPSGSLQVSQQRVTRAQSERVQIEHRDENKIQQRVQRGCFLLAHTHRERDERRDERQSLMLANTTQQNTTHTPSLHYLDAHRMLF